MTCPHGSPSVIHDAIGIDQEKAIVALINEATVKQAATVVGVSETTLYRWMREATFAKAYREARRESFRHAIALTQLYAPHAVQILMKVANDPAAPHNAKLTAAMGLLKFSRESIELDDLASRIEALELTAGEPGALPMAPRPAYPNQAA